MCTFEVFPDVLNVIILMDEYDEPYTWNGSLYEVVRGVSLNDIESFVRSTVEQVYDSDFPSINFEDGVDNTLPNQLIAIIDGEY